MAASGSVIDSHTATQSKTISDDLIQSQASSKSNTKAVCVHHTRRAAAAHSSKKQQVSHQIAALYKSLLHQRHLLGKTIQSQVTTVTTAAVVASAAAVATPANSMTT